jgi:hypothetical protein
MHQLGEPGGLLLLDPNGNGMIKLGGPTSLDGKEEGRKEAKRNSDEE